MPWLTTGSVLCQTLRLGGLEYEFSMRRTSASLSLARCLTRKQDQFLLQEFVSQDNQLFHSTDNRIVPLSRQGLFTNCRLDPVLLSATQNGFETHRRRHRHLSLSRRVTLNRFARTKKNCLRHFAVCRLLLGWMGMCRALIKWIHVRIYSSPFSMNVPSKITIVLLLDCNRCTACERARAGHLKILMRLLCAFARQRRTTERYARKYAVRNFARTIFPSSGIINLWMAAD